jgi:hypothetical protein
VISPSFPEPLCDVAAQIGALLDRNHPKEAVWLAAGTPCPDVSASGLIAIQVPSGRLLTAKQGIASRFLAAQTDETLASILGYPETKWRVSGVPVVVRARDGRGAVITEMLSSPHLVDIAAAVAAQHGEVEIATICDVLLRRQRLRERETRCCSATFCPAF